VPSFYWWALSSDTRQSGAAVRVIGEFRRDMALHLPALVIGARRAEHKTDSLTLEVWETPREEGRELLQSGGWDAFSALTSLIGIPTFGLGTIVALTKRALTDRKTLNDRQQMHPEGTTVRVESGVAGLVEEIRRFSRPEMPVIVAVEDLHWMGADMAEFLDDMAAPRGDRPVLLIATAWPEGESEEQCHSWLARALASGRAEVLTLPNLDPPDLGSLVRQSTPNRDEGTVDRVVTRWPNPLTIQILLRLEIMRSRIRDGVLSVTDAELTKIPWPRRGGSSRRYTTRTECPHSR
jgi:hypothetical protein